MKSKTKKTLIIAISIIVIIGITCIVINTINFETKTKNNPKEEVETNQESITTKTPEEILKMLEETEKVEGYSFKYIETKNNEIIINQINDATGEIWQIYKYNTKIDKMNITTYETSSNSATFE